MEVYSHTGIWLHELFSNASLLACVCCSPLIKYADTCWRKEIQWDVKQENLQLWRSGM